MSNQFNVNILVNGNKCKQYSHDSRKYIEAKNGSEWYLKIKNNTNSRILAVCSVDGLNVLTGESASPDDSGYIIDSYNSRKIKGFRVSDSSWALFKFGYKSNGKTYAQSKNDGSEKNCGVIGIKLFYEKIEQVFYYNQMNSPQWSGSCANNTLGGFYTQGRHGICGQSCDNSYYNDFQLYDSTIKSSTPLTLNYMSNTRGFDSGTEFGRAEKSKVKTIEFKRGIEALSTNIYYASRASLIEMGVPLTNEIKVNFPESFPNKYCKPPKNWNG